MRRLALTGIALLVVGVAHAGTAGRASSSPLSLGGGTTMNGSVFAGDGRHAQIVRFFPNKKFAAGFVLDNNSHRPVVVTQVRVIEPARTLLHQTGTRFHAYNPNPCPPGESCPAPTFAIGSGIAHQPRPFRVGPGTEVGVELDFREGSCTSVPTASGAPISQLRVTFHARRGAARHEVIKLLDGSKIRLRMPNPADCTFPRSRLGVNINYHLDTDFTFTYPGSKGDVCTRTPAGLSFRSRAMLSDDRKPERIEIRVGHFSGTGTYRSALATVVVHGKDVFRHSGLVIVNKATSSEVFAQVRLDRVHTGMALPPYAIYGSMRCKVVRG